MKYTKNLIPAEYLTVVEETKAAIIAGEIDVWDVSSQGYPEFYD